MTAAEEKPAKKTKKKHKALPSGVYCYGCTAPPDDIDAVFTQMWLANRYRNQLAEIERGRRDASNAILGDADEKLAAANAMLADLDQQIADIKAEKKRRNMVARKRGRHPDLNAKLATVMEARKAASAQCKLIKDEAYGNPQHAAALEQIEASTTAAVKAARKIARCEWGLHWATYQAVEQAAQSMRRGKPPKFRSFRRENGGMIAVHIQSEKTEPKLTVERLFAGEDTYVKLTLEPTPANASKRRQRKPTALLQLCIGSKNPAANISLRNPAIYTTVRVTLHRPLPPDCHVTWVKLIAKRVGTYLKWDAQFTVAKAEGFPTTTGQYVVGIDIGYRQIPDTELVVGKDGTAYRDLRVAYWAGSDGRHGELRLPARLVAALAHKDNLQSLRDQKFNIIKATLIAWRKGSTLTPAWFLEETKTLDKWRSLRRLRCLVRQWRANRFDGDAGIFFQMDAWEKEDKHHLNWLATEANRARNWRDDLYRKFAAELRRHYGVCGLENLDLREHAQADHLSKTVQKQRSQAAISRLRQFLAKGMKTVKVPAANTTARCHRCLHINHVGSEMTYGCRCGWVGDRDYNAAQNILREVQCVLKTADRSQEAA